MKPTDRIFCAIDTTDVDAATALAGRLVGHVGGIKLGKEFFTAHGPEGVRKVTACGMPLFLDLKFHDIPNTVAGAIRAALPLKPSVLNVHASGGRAMMEAAAEAAAGADGTLLIGVTILTSLSDKDVAEVGYNGSAAESVVRLAKLAEASGLGGVVCSPREIEAIRAACGPDFKLVVPGIRPTWSATGD